MSLMPNEEDTLTVCLPSRHTGEWSQNVQIESYDIRATHGGKQIAKIKVTVRGNPEIYGNPKKPGDTIHFFFDTTTRPPTPKPYVEWQETEPEYRGRGICGRLIKTANNFYRGRLGTPIHSSTHFILDNPCTSKRVWQKLEEQGLAMHEPYHGKSRWRMIK